VEEEGGGKSCWFNSTTQSCRMAGDGRFDGFSIATIVLLAAVMIVPLVAFTLLSRRLCCDKQLRHYFRNTLKMAQHSSRRITQQAPPRMLLSFRDVRYSVSIGKNEEKFILQGVSAYFSPGTMTAVMGPSGCGKSTLLDVVADQKEFGFISGDIRVNGRKRDGLFRRASAYVMQFDVLHEQLTPRETLFFITELRLGEAVSAEEKYQRIDMALADLDLTHVADTRIGSGEGGGGLSGGQKRRVTVGIELVTNPGLILLDEPTSGLDAFGSLELVKVLSCLAGQGRTIACTIHQPRADIFRLFDKLLLMKLGLVMYFGPIDGIFPYFESLGVQVDYSVNPADFIVDLTKEKSAEEMEEERLILEKINKNREAAPPVSETSIPMENDDNSSESTMHMEEKEIEERVEGKRNVPRMQKLPSVREPLLVDLDMICDAYQKSDLRRENLRTIWQVKTGRYEDTPPVLNEVFSDNVHQKYATSFQKQVYALARRSIINDMRNPAYVFGNWVIGPIMMLFYGALYSNVDQPSTANSAAFESILDELQVCNLDDSSLLQFNPPLSIISGPNPLIDCGAQVNEDQQLAFVRASLIYQFMAAAFFSEAPWVAQVFQDKRMYFREHAARSYSSGAYHMNLFIRIFFSAFMKGLFFTPIGYFAAGLKIEAEPYFIFAIIFGGMSATGASVAVFVASVFPGLEIASSVFVFINILAQNLSGFWVVEAFVPPWFIWLFYINFFQFAFQGAVEAQSLPASTELRDDAWFSSLLVIIFAIIFQMLAFISTWLAHRSDESANEQQEQELSEEFSDESFLKEAEEKLSTKRFQQSSVSQGVSRRNLFARYREAQLQSTRDYSKREGIQINTALANNGGAVHY